MINSTNRPHGKQLQGKTTKQSSDGTLGETTVGIAGDMQVVSIKEEL